MLAIILKEPEGPRFSQLVARAERPRMSAAGYVEASLVLEPRGMGHELALWIEDVGVEIVPISVDQAFAAAEAGKRFGKRHHSAELNFGDCFAYALAKVSGAPLLFKGNDFPQTDIPAAG